jgi:hypothetical protein
MLPYFLDYNYCLLFYMMSVNEVHLYIIVFKVANPLIIVIY